MLNKKDEKPQRKRFERRNVEFSFSLIPVVTNNTELDTLLHLLPILDSIKNGNYKPENQYIKSILQVFFFKIFSLLKFFFFSFLLEIKM